MSAWVAVCALLLGALMPALMRMSPPGGETAWQAICSSVGLQSAAPDGGDKLQGNTAPAPEGDPLGDHCPWCSLHTMALGLPPVSLLAMPLLTLRHVLPPLFLSSPYTLQAWTSAQPRAPPRIS